MCVCFTGREGVTESTRGRRDVEETAGETETDRSRKTKTGRKRQTEVERQRQVGKDRQVE